MDRALVEDGNLITSRKPDDLPVFGEVILRRLAGRASDQAGRGAGASPDAASP